LKTDPQNREALANLTSLEAERAPGDALTRLMNLEREYPSFSPIKAQIGLAYARMDNLEAAVDYLRRAVAITPTATLYQYNIALALDRLGRREQAVQAYDQVLASVSAGRALPEISVADIQRRLNFLRAK
jgi:tetratricopeptide (TPR) repeat protein